MKRLVFLSLFFLGSATASYSQRVDSVAIYVSSLAAWDIEFHAILPNGQYIQDRRNPHREDVGAIVVFNNGHLAAQYYKIGNSSCYTGTPVKDGGNPAVLIYPTDCAVYNRFDDMLWVLKSKMEVVRLESLERKASGGTDY